MGSLLKHNMEYICYNYTMFHDTALYVHVPFCRRKCRYCSFVSYERREAEIPRYMNALKTELRQRSGKECVRSVYIGGGTPSLLPAGEIGGLLSTIADSFALDKAAEISLEANPGTIDGEYLKAVRQLGVNRLSLGVQSFNDTELMTLGRIHTANEAADSVHLARNAGFDNLNLDLIYGIPGQTLADWRYSLEKALELAPEHLSFYALTLEPETPMQSMIDAGSLPAIDPDLSADQYELAEDLLSAGGYVHYEISNWAKPGRECRHNLVYWHNLPYLGIGAAAHSCINGHRLANSSNLDKYIADFTGQSSWVPVLDEKINNGLELAETVILGMRLGEGVKIDYLKRRFGINILDKYSRQIKEMAEMGLLHQADGYLTLTRRGRLLSNEVFWRFLPESQS